MDDRELLNRYATTGSDQAFETLVSRYSALVYSSALRRAGPSLADDITQAVFIILARKAPRLYRTHPLNLTAWLFKTTRYAASEALRAQARRLQREQTAEERQQMIAEEASDTRTWTRLAPVLDDALDHLNTRDRQAILLRFFRDASFAEIGQALRVSENTATKRVARALDKLRATLGRKGMTVSSGVLTTLLLANAAEAVPTGLTAACMSAAAPAAATTVATAGAVAIADGALKTILVTQLKTAAVAVCVIAAAGAGTIATVSAVTPPSTGALDILKLERISTFPLKYMARSRLPDHSFEFQLNSQLDGRSHFAKIGESVHGFTLLSHFEKEDSRLLPGMTTSTPVDVSELVLERDGRNTVLVKDDTHDLRRDHVALLSSSTDDHTYCLRTGDILQVAGDSYELLDVDLESQTVTIRRLGDGTETVMAITKQRRPVP